VVRVNGVRRVLDGAAVTLPGGGSLRVVTPQKRQARRAVLVIWPDGSQLRVEHFVTPSSTWFNTTLAVPGRHAGRLTGLLGNADGRRDNELVIPGAGVVDPTDFHAVHRGFADAWRITDAVSLFHYRAGESTATFTDRTFPARAFTAADLSPGQRAHATRVCADQGVAEQPFLDQCLVDVTLTGDDTVAAAVRAAQVSATPDMFTVDIGDTVAPNLPGPGAGLIEERGARDTYEFAARAGERVMISTLAIDGDRSCAADSALRLRVIDPEGRGVSDHLARHLGGSSGCGRWTFELPAPGEHRLEVSLYEPDVARGRPDRGGYALRLEPAPRVVRPATLGSRVTGDLRYAGQVDVHEFAGRTGQTVVIDVLSVAGDGQCAGAALAWDVLSPTGVDLDGPGLTHGVATRDCGSGEVRLPETGRYQLVLYNRAELLGRGASGLGRYELALRGP
jgi:hypothetical protein